MISVAQTYCDFMGINLYELVFVANIGFFLALLNFSSGIIDAYLTWEHNNKEYLVLFKAIYSLKEWVVLNQE